MVFAFGEKPKKTSKFNHQFINEKKNYGEKQCGGISVVVEWLSKQV